MVERPWRFVGLALMNGRVGRCGLVVEIYGGYQMYRESRAKRRPRRIGADVCKDGERVEALSFSQAWNGRNKGNTVDTVGKFP